MLPAADQLEPYERERTVLARNLVRSWWVHGSQILSGVPVVSKCPLRRMLGTEGMVK